MTPIKNKEKIGNVWLRYISPGCWEVYWYDRKTKNPIRHQFKASTHKLAKQVAINYDNQHLIDRELLPTSRQTRKTGGHTVLEALTDTIKNSRANNLTRRDYNNCANLFLVWLGETLPEIKFWRELKPFHLEQYLKYCQGEKRAFDTIRKRFYIIRATSLYMAENYFEKNRDIARGVKVDRPAKRPEPQALSMEDVVILLDHSRKYNPGVYPILLLQALCGLRIREIISLREMDIDLQAGTVNITETPQHKPKTRNSYRTIPIPMTVVEVLREIITGRKIQGSDTYPITSWSESWVCHLLKKAFQKTYLDSKRDIFLNFQPRRLRATFVTLATKAGVSEIYLKRHIGHSSGSILGQHYQSITLDDLQREVVQKVEIYFNNQTLEDKTIYKNIGNYRTGYPSNNS